MANLQQLTVLQGGVEHWNAWRDENPYTNIDLSGIDFTEAQFSGINLSGADLRDADFTKADLSFSDLRRANLGDAILKGTQLHGSDLREVTFSTTDKEEDLQAREPAAVYSPKQIEPEINLSSPPSMVSKGDPASSESHDLQVLFDSGNISQEDMAGALAFLNDLYVSIGGDQLVITHVEQYPMSSAS